MKFPAAQLEQLKLFIGMVEQKPDLIHHEDLGFFKSYLQSMGAKLPAEPEEAWKEDKEMPVPEEEKKQEEVVEEMEPEVESEPESDVELDMEGVIGTYSAFYSA